MKCPSLVLAALLLLAACGPAPAPDPAPGSPGSSASSSPAAWDAYQDDTLGIRIGYPPAYLVSPMGEAALAAEITFGDDAIAVEGVRIGDDVPEGQGTHLYRTTDADILKYLQQDKPFTGKKTVNGITYNRFELIGLGDAYGYVTERDGHYYVFESLWGPDNPVYEKMLRSLAFLP